MSAEIDPLAKQKQAEKELKRYRDHLEDLVIERTAELRAANQQLQREIAERKLAEAERERLLIAEREQRLLAETMQEVILALASQTNHAAVLNEILRQTQRIVQYNTANITLLQDDLMRVAFWQGYEAFNTEEFVANLTQTLVDFPLERSVTQSRIPLVIHDTQQQPGWVMLAETAWIRSYLIVPICLQDQVLGLLRLGANTPGKFSIEDAQRLQALAHAAAIALENARLHAETETRLREQMALREAGAVISSTLDLTTVLNYIIEQMGRAIDATSAYISGYNPDFSWTVLAEYYGPEASVAEKGGSDLGVTYSAPEDDPEYLNFLRAGRIEVLHPDGPNIHEITRDQLQQYGAQSALLIPLRINGELIAFADLWESRYRREFTQAEINLCQTIAQQAAMAIHNAQLYQQTQRQARQMEQILHSVRAGILLLDADRRVKLANTAGQNYLAVLAGVEVGQVLSHLGGRPLADVLVFLPPGQSHELTPVGVSNPLFHVYANPVVAGQVETEGWVMVVRDVTDERDIQKRMQQQEKLAAVGQLAAGIAHDFNNILTSIIGFAELARYSSNLPLTVYDDLGHIVQQGQRAAHLVRQILDFARKNMIARRTIDLGQLLAETVKFLERTIPEDIQLDLKIEPNQAGYSLNADPTQLQQALTNLAVNAADAMPTGGILKFNLLRFTLVKGQYPLYPELHPGDWLALTVSDTGVGMSAEVQKHLFEPFFTTKEVGQGTGLGLAQVEGIIKQHEGYIQVGSRVGQGTIFTLYFPALASSLPAETPTPMSQGSQQQGQGKLILLVEDNQSVREVVQAMLTSLGYEVLVASNGRSALQIYEQSQARITLVITDITMPEMGGLALAEALRLKNPAVKILAMSGYPLKMATRELSAQGIVGWLQKPLSFDQLAQRLKQVL
jgi:signal transduction histidine kinase/putative methionine-R-sulfoxide reductase with GAF domain